MAGKPLKKKIGYAYKTTGILKCLRKHEYFEQHRIPLNIADPKRIIG